MDVVNLTPHRVTVVLDDGSRLDIPPSGVVARVSVECKKAGEIKIEGRSVPYYECVPGRVEADGPIPEARAYIVSRVVAEAVKQGKAPEPLMTHMVFVPATGPGFAVRDEQGRIVGVRALEVVPNPVYAYEKLKKEVGERWE